MLRVTMLVSATSVAPRPILPGSAAVLPVAGPTALLDFESRIVRATDTPAASRFGFRFGARGTHTSRTMMLAELSQLLASTAVSASPTDYVEAVVDGNCLGKRTASNRRISLKRLTELYGLDHRLLLFRVMRTLWQHDVTGRPLLAMLLALARDPLLRATIGSVLAHTSGSELVRRSVEKALTEAVGDRLGTATLNTTVRNVASSWTQSGHLRGRTRKIRQQAKATPGATAYALLLGHLAGERGSRLFETPWAAVLDAPIGTLFELAADAKRLGLINLKHSGSMVDVSFPTLMGNARS